MDASHWHGYRRSLRSILSTPVVLTQSTVASQTYNLPNDSCQTRFGLGAELHPRGVETDRAGPGRGPGGTHRVLRNDPTVPYLGPYPLIFGLGLCATLSPLKLFSSYVSRLTSRIKPSAAELIVTSIDRPRFGALSSWPPPSLCSTLIEGMRQVIWGMAWERAKGSEVCRDRRRGRFG
jgi:hypothetical protein